LPKGFNEQELKKFFTQFGEISKLRVARSKDTARPKGYAFMQFKESKVAEVAAKAMNKYMMFGRNLDVHVMEDAHKEMFKHGNRDWKFVPKQLMHRNKINKEEKTDAQRKARVEGLLQKERERRDRLKELEIVYDFPGFSALVVKPKKAPAVKEVKKEEPKAKREQEPKKESTKQQISTKT
jgi:nucleolar protein 15